MVGIICPGRLSIYVDQIWVNLMKLIEEFTEKNMVLVPCGGVEFRKLQRKNTHKFSSFQVREQKSGLALTSVFGHGREVVLSEDGP